MSSSSSDSDSSDSEPEISLEEAYQERIEARRESNSLVPQDPNSQGIVQTSQDIEPTAIPKLVENIIKEPVNHEIHVNGSNAQIDIGPLL